MSDRWLITDAEDEKLQGLTADAQVIYMRLFRRYMSFDTGRAEITLAQMKRAIEYIPDNGSNIHARRVSEITNDHVRARSAELERAGLIAKLPKKTRFDTPAYTCVLAFLGKVRLEKEPQGNPKRGTPRESQEENPTTARLSVVSNDAGTTREPQERNPKTSDYPDKETPTDVGVARTRQARLDTTVLPADLSAQVWADFLQHRKDKRSPVKTQTVVNTVAKELERARALGWSPDEAMAEAMAAGWQTVKADWLANRTKKPAGGDAGHKRRSGFSEINYEQEAIDAGFKTGV